MTQSTETRVERKERTRRAILDAALYLSQESSLAAVSLRQVAKEVGVVPTAFYRHFASVDQLALSLVEESFEHLRQMLREVRKGSATTGMIEQSVLVLGTHVRQRRDNFSFIVRERQGGTATVRDAVRHELDLFERELATDLARLPGSTTYSAEDLHVVANLIVNVVVSAVEDLLAAGSTKAEDAILDRLAAQLRMLTIGAANWRST